MIFKNMVATLVFSDEKVKIKTTVSVKWVNNEQEMYQRCSEIGDWEYDIFSE